MHEMSLMAGVFDIIGQNMVEYPMAKILRVRLVVGALTNVAPDAMQLAFDVMSKGTPVAGAELEISEVPLTARCEDCGWQGEIGQYKFLCPDCASQQLEILTGRELYLDSLEVE